MYHYYVIPIGHQTKFLIDAILDNNNLLRVVKVLLEATELSPKYFLKSEKKVHQLKFTCKLTKLSDVKLFIAKLY